MISVKQKKVYAMRTPTGAQKEKQKTKETSCYIRKLNENTAVTVEYKEQLDLL